MTFGGLSQPLLRLDADFAAERWIGQLTDPLDDLYGALGNFALRVVVQGSVQPGAGPSVVPHPRPSATSGVYTVSIEQVGIYVLDSYDFDNDQWLGFWSRTGVSRGPGLGRELVTNGDFRTWRTRQGRGGDYYVFSDLRVHRRQPPDTFTVF